MNDLPFHVFDNLKIVCFSPYILSCNNMYSKSNMLSDLNSIAENF